MTIFACNKVLSTFCQRAKILPALCDAFAVESAEMCSELGQLSPSQLCQSISQCDQRGLVYEPESRSGTELEIIGR